MKASLPVLILCLLHSPAEAVKSPYWNGVGVPGTDAVSLSIGGVRSLPYSGPGGVSGNPSSFLQGRERGRMLLSMGIKSFEDGFTDYSGWNDHSGILSSGSAAIGICFPIDQVFALDFSGTGAAHVPPTTVLRPSSSGGAPDTITTESSVTEMLLACAWATGERLVVGAGLGIRGVDYKGTVRFGEAQGGAVGSTLESLDDEFLLRVGATAPLEGLTLGLALELVGPGNEVTLASGGVFDINDFLSAGAEIELCGYEGEALYTGRFFTEINPASFVTLRGGVFHSTGHSMVSRRGTGYSSGASWNIGRFSVTTAFSRWSMSGSGSYLGIPDHDLFRGDYLVFSAGIEHRFPIPASEDQAPGGSI